MTAPTTATTTTARRADGAGRVSPRRRRRLVEAPLPGDVGALDPTPAEYRGRPAAVLSGGDRDGWVYYRAALAARAAAWAATGHGPRFPYRRTDGLAPHPVHGDAVPCEVWRFDPSLLPAGVGGHGGH